MALGFHSSEPAVSRLSPALLPVFLGATFLSAALIFVIQPMFTRFVLPRLGGSPGVWSVAMVFFQAVLFAGYLYAHALMRWAPPRMGVSIHVTVTAAALLWLPLGIARGWGEPPVTGEALWLLGLFAMSIGVPYFALSANGPLLQAWFVRASHGTKADPYFLYAVSNAGSFLALLLYPLAIEPLTTLAGQSRMWTLAYALLALLIAGCGYLVWVRAPADMAAHKSVGAPPTAQELLRWTALAAVPTALLIAVTAQISTDIAAIPLVWVVPLALYLLTLVVVFRSWSSQAHRIVANTMPLALLALVGIMVLLPESNLEGWRFFAELGLHLGVFVLVAFLCHGELVQRRPDPSHLTIFYLAMSFGGMLGGVFASLIAPNVFSWVAEYPIMLVAAALCLPRDNQPNWSTSTAVQVGAGCLALALVAPGLMGAGALLQSDLGKTIIGAGCVAAGLVTMRSPVLLAIALAVALASVRLYPPEGATAVTYRSFFGVHKVHDSEDGNYRLLLHGTTVHGAQRIRTADGKPETGRPEPLTYYRVDSPIAEALKAVRARKAGGVRVGVIGLGTGSMSCLVEDKDELVFFEIDTTVIKRAIQSSSRSSLRAGRRCQSSLVMRG